MSQDSLTKLMCTVCQRVDYFTRRNRKLKAKLELSKHCPHCRKHTDHKETK